MPKSHKRCSISPEYRRIALFGPVADVIYQDRTRNEFLNRCAQNKLARVQDRERQRVESNTIDWDNVRELLDEFPRMSLNEAKAKSRIGG